MANMMCPNCLTERADMVRLQSDGSCPKCEYQRRQKATNHIKIATVTIRRINWKRVPLANGFTSEKDGCILADVDVWVDAKAIAEAIGDKAMRSKSHQSKLQSGAVTVCAKNIRIV